MGRWLSPACFLRQPSLEETSLPAAAPPGLSLPLLCAYGQAPAVPSPARSVCLHGNPSLSSHTHPYPACAMSCTCCHPHLSLLEAQAPHPVPSPPTAVSWQWDVRASPSRRACTRLCPEQYGTYMDILVARGQE